MPPSIVRAWVLTGTVAAFLACGAADSGPAAKATKALANGGSGDSGNAPHGGAQTSPVPSTPSPGGKPASGPGGGPGNPAGPAPAPGTTAGPSNAPAGAAYTLVDAVATGADGAFDYTYSIPIGWGYMDPEVAVIGADVYTPLYYPLSLDVGGTKKLYNIQFLKNGATFGPPLSMAYQFIPAGYSTQEAYQPPMVFVSGTKIIVAYWVLMASSGTVSIVNFAGLDTAAASPAWTSLITYYAPAGHIFNYLGGAMGPNGDIYLAGWNSDGDASSLDLVRFAAGSLNATVSTVASYSSPAFRPIYPHVVVDAANVVSVLFDVGNMNPCNGQAVTNYKNVALYRGTFPTITTGVFSDAASDAVALPATNGDPCQSNNGRFPLDLLYDKASGHVYSAVRWTEGTTQKVQIYDEATVVIPDLARLMPKIFETGASLDAVTITKAGGKFVLIANARDKSDHKTVGVIATADFKTYTPPLGIPTKYGAGNAVKVSQPDKNGSAATDKVFFWYAGNLLNPESKNEFLNFTLGTLDPAKL